jgi:AcrR family transcriptional regulator
MATTPLRRETYHHGNLRAGFIAAGLTLVDERGVYGFSLREASRALGVSPSAAYRHFADKESLLEAIADDGANRMADEMHAAGLRARVGRSGAHAAIAELWAYAETVIAFAVDNGACFRVMSTCKGRHGRDEERSEVAALARQAFEELIRCGAMPADNLERAMLATWAGTFGLATLITEGLAHRDELPFRTAALDAVVRTALLGVGVDGALLPPPPLPRLSDDCPG